MARDDRHTRTYVYDFNASELLEPPRLSYRKCAVGVEFGFVDETTTITGPCVRRSVAEFSYALC